MKWKHGYYADSGYTYDYHVETSPARLGWVANIKGFEHPSSNFRYLDLGCGQGLSIITMAAMHPDSEFVGVDFMPEHIAHARQLANNAGLTNVTFVEADFMELVKEPHSFGEFDYAVAHGISTWVSFEVREAMFILASKALKPGGIMFNSYNTYPGWLPMAPFQQLVIQLQSKHSASKAIQIAKEKLINLQSVDSPIFGVLPTLVDRLDQLKTSKQSYLVQEYNNAYWQPVYSSQMLEIAKRNKLELMSTASLPEIFEGCYPKPMWDAINLEEEPILKEFIRDLALAQNFRRDIYIKGGLRYWKQEAPNKIDEQIFVSTQLMLAPKNDEDFIFKSGVIKIQGKINIYKPIIEEFGINGASFKEVLKKHPEHTRDTLLQVTSLLLHGNWLGLVGTNNQKHSKELNTALAKATLNGAPYEYLCCPKIQTAFKFSQLDLMMVGLLSQSNQPNKLEADLIDNLKLLNIKISLEDTIVDKSNLGNSQISLIVKEFLENKYKVLQGLGAI